MTHGFCVTNLDSVTPARRTLPRFLAALSLVGATLVSVGLSAPQAEAAVARHQVKLASFSTDAELAKGVQRGTRVRGGAVVFDTPSTVGVVDGRRWEMARYATPWVTTSVAFDEVIPSWQATTPGKSAIRVQVRGRTADGKNSSWDNVAFWAAADTSWKRHTYSAQPDDLGRMSVDTWQATTPMTSWQVRVDLLRPVGGKKSPSVQRISGVTSKLATATWFPASPPGANNRAKSALGKVLAVPQYSQMVHRGHYPQWGGGGEAWCSPTSMAMVLGYYGALPLKNQGANTWGGMNSAHTDAVVDFSARATYDHTYRGAGNWAFSTAYAGTRGRDGWVTRMRSLTEVEQQIAAGTPVVVSVRFARGELPGAPIRATNGHLMVVVGFDQAGNVVVNDPAAPTNSSVRRTYPRAAFENVWLPRSPSGSGGLAYIIR